MSNGGRPRDPQGGIPMRQLLCAAATALVGLAMSTQTQAAAPPVWDGVIVPTSSAECVPSNPIFWSATYRPYISDAISGAGQPSQLVVFGRLNINDIGYRLANTAAGQFNGGTDKTANVFFLNADQMNTAGPTAGTSTATIHLTQTPTAITAANYLSAATTWIKITGTVKIGVGPGMFCATNIRGVFVRRPGS